MSLVEKKSTTIVVMLGSVREDSNTAKVVQIIADELATAGAFVDVIDPRTLPLVIPELPGKQEECKALETALRARVSAASGVILVTPEYDGSYSAVMKLLLEYLGYPSVLFGMPVAILGAASGRIGAGRAVDHMRSLCLHIGAFVLPRSPSLAAVHKLFDANGACVDAEAETKIRGMAKGMLAFVAKIGR